MPHRIEAALLGQAAARVFHPALKGAARSILGGPFLPGTDRRLLIYYHPNAICWANIYPFLHHARDFHRAHRIGIRALPIGRLLQDGPRRDADIVLIQPWFTESAQAIGTAVAACRDRLPQARIAFVDSFAHTDLRFGTQVEPCVNLYLRKALFRDRREFLIPRRGDTNLTEYYSDLYGIEAGEPVDWHVPEPLLGKLGLLQNFLMAPSMMRAFREPLPEIADRPIDLNLRIAARGTPWYEAMRRDAIATARSLPGISVTSEDRIPHDRFLDEMRQCRLCFSPFGYGEICWRDIEAFLTGAVLIKPDMGHLDTLPDLYRPGETYLPVRWDFADLDEVVSAALADADLRRRIALNAHDACRAYLGTGAFVMDMAKALGL